MKDEPVLWVSASREQLAPFYELNLQPRAWLMC
jgi:hypothetical protein